MAAGFVGLSVMVTGISAMMTDENLLPSALLVAVMVAVEVDATGIGAV